MWLIDVIDWLMHQLVIVSDEAVSGVVFDAELKSELQISVSLSDVIDWCDWLIDASVSDCATLGVFPW